jgi:hypothetical protein
MSCFNHLRAIVVVSIKLHVTIAVSSIHRHALEFKISASWSILQVELDRAISLLSIIASSITEITSFIHILPKSIELYALPEVFKVASPPCGGLRVEVVRVGSIIRPDLTNKNFIVGSFDK